MHLLLWLSTNVYAEAPSSTAAPLVDAGPTDAGECGPERPAHERARDPRCWGDAERRHARKVFDAGSALTLGGAIALPTGAVNVAVGAANLDATLAGRPQPFPVGDAASFLMLVGGAGMVAGAMPATLVGLEVERHALTRAGCARGGLALRAAPFVLFGLSAGAWVGGADDRLVNGAFATGWVAAAAEHVVHQRAARRCDNLRRGPAVRGESGC